jgi:phage terminase large subunit
VIEERAILAALERIARMQDSIRSGIQWIQNLEIIIHPRCTNFITEISNYTWDKDKFGEMLDGPIDDFNHLMDAMRYALEKHIINKKWTY